jgi:hypothetical protein
LRDRAATQTSSSAGEITMLDEDEFWNNTLSLAFEKQPSLATALAQHFDELRDKLAEGKVQEVIEILNDGITEIYPYTDFHQACFKLYRRYISKQGLLPAHDPLTVEKDLEEADRKREAKLKRKKPVKAKKKRKPMLKIVKGKKAA